MYIDILIQDINFKVTNNLHVSLSIKNNEINFLARGVKVYQNYHNHSF